MKRASGEKRLAASFTIYGLFLALTLFGQERYMSTAKGPFFPLACLVMVPLLYREAKIYAGTLKRD